MNPSVTESRRARRIVLCIVLLAGTLLLLTGMTFAAVPNSLPNRQHRVINSCPAGYTVCSVQSGDWDDPTTWSPPRIPDITDNVAILPGHHIYLADNVGRFVNSLLVSGGTGGTLAFSGAFVEGWCDVRIIATTQLINDGIVRAGTAGDRGCDVVISVAGQLTGHGLYQSGAAPGGCIGGWIGADGGDVVLTAGIINLSSHPDFDFNVLGGRSNLHSDGCSAGGHGGDISLYATGSFTTTDIMVQAGRGGHVRCNGSAGSGGNLDWYGNPVLFNGASFEAGSGGHTANCPSPPPRPPRQPRGRNRGEPPQSLQATPNIMIMGDTQLQGETVEIYGSAGWTIAFESDEEDHTPIISATNDITLTTGVSGTLLFSGVLSNIFTVSDPTGMVTFQSDFITSSVPLDALVTGNTAVVTSTSGVIYGVEVMASDEGAVSAVVGVPFLVVFRVQNLSSVVDTIDLQFQAGGWAVSPTSTALTLSVFEVAEIPVSVTPLAAGQQTLTLLASSQTEPGTAYDSADVTLEAFAVCPSIPSLDFSVSGQAAFGAIRPGTPATLQASPPGAGWNLGWEFSDGTKGSGDVIQHTFNIPGVYDITLTAGNDCGSSRSVTHTLSVFYTAGLPIISRR